MGTGTAEYIFFAPARVVWLLRKIQKGRGKQQDLDSSPGRGLAASFCSPLGPKPRSGKQQDLDSSPGRGLAASFCSPLGAKAPEDYGVPGPVEAPAIGNGQQHLGKLPAGGGIPLR